MNVSEKSCKKQPRTIRIGAVRYLNARPLTYCLKQVAPHVELFFDVPSRLADSLKSGKLDVAMIPSIEYFSQPGYAIVSDACIACRGAVRSVRFFSRVPIERIRLLALDEGSRTSAVLIRILLKEQFNLEPKTCTLPVGASAADIEADAALLIGDRGIAPNHCRFEHVWDLGERWKQWTGLPFVFAMWIARPEAESLELDKLLTSARDEGIKLIPEIARLEAANFQLSPEECLAYLRDHLHFYLGPREREGLQLFYKLAERHGFISSNELFPESVP